jgi:hypothetical protein
MWDCIVEATIMSESSHISSNGERLREEQTNKSRKTPSQAGGETVPDLQLTIVSYDDSPNRGTIHPPDLTGIERMETWMSVDLSVVAALSMWR